MRIAYGVMGYGRGHAMRSGAVLPSLMAEHEVTVFAGGDAYDVLAPQFPTVRIPIIGYAYNERGGHSTSRTLSRNFSPMADLLFGGAGSALVEKEFRERGIDLVISDSEAWTHRAAQKLKIPRISYDHVGIIAYCKPHFPPDLRLLGMRDAIGYRALMGIPERILISSFYPAQPAYPNMHIVGPMLRPEVLKVQPRDGKFLMAYFNKGEHQYLPHIDRALRLLDLPVVVYGTPFRGQSENIDFRAPSNEGFIRDLAGCKAVLSTAGNQLIGEAIHFSKPILAVPEEAFEQRLNAYMIERMGVGMRGDRHRLTPSDIDRFMGNYDYYRSNMGEHAGDGRAEATETLHRYVNELGRKPVRSKRARKQRNAGPADERVPVGV
ncbi:glycosyltransferase family protein [Nevskia soli]|uniref:glycosyltransferase family protein n=1 Tax=Nevskia soli TaxID=418856 RepID=UPI00068F57E3|nr:glycosyltransferase family protein [Nevskia soli]